MSSVKIAARSEGTCSSNIPHSSSNPWYVLYLYSQLILIDSIDAINNTRQVAISSAIATLEQLIAYYNGTQPRCSCQKDIEFECDAMVLGALVKGSKEIGLSPLAPPSCMSFHHLSKEIRRMKIPTMCDWNRKRNTFYQVDYSKSCCNVKEVMNVSLKDLEDQLCGLDLELKENERVAFELFSNPYVTSDNTPTSYPSCNLIS